MRNIVLALFILCLANGHTLAVDINWVSLAPGMELCWVTSESPSHVGDSRILVIRVDPSTWQLDLIDHSRLEDSENKTAREWAHEHNLALAINAGMFATDYRTHVGYMEQDGQINSDEINDYQSVTAFNPRRPDLLPFQIFDLDTPGVTVQTIRQDYASLVQNLRLIKKPGENRWKQQDNMWSEVALGEDSEGNVLFVYSRSPFSMHDFNNEMLAAEIDLVALQHLDGGPPAQLYINVGDFELDYCGSYETNINENDANQISWPIPFVLGLKQK